MPRIPKNNALKMLADVSREYAFWIHDGGVLINMSELQNALDGMSKETFDYHANNEKNDFANWVRDVIKDDKLADDLIKAPSQKDAVEKVSDRLIALKKAIG